MNRFGRASYPSDDEIKTIAWCMTVGAFLLLLVGITSFVAILGSIGLGLVLGLAIGLLVSPLLYVKFISLSAAYVEHEVDTSG